VPHTDPEVLALRALGEDAGTSADQEHIASCAECRAELARLADVVAIARRDGPAVRLARPPEQVWQRIAAAAGVTEAAQPAPDASGRSLPGGTLPPAADGGAEDTPRARPRTARRGFLRRPRGRLAAAAAGLVIGAGAAAGVASVIAAPAQAPPVVAQIDLRPLPQFPQWQGASGTAVMRAAAATRLLDVTLHAPARPGFYEVWLLGRDGVSMISLGDLPASHTGSFTIPPGTNLGFYSRIDVSLQPFNGSPVHSKTSVVRGSLPPGGGGASAARS
jgi:hypothetical protein